MKLPAVVASLILALRLPASPIAVLAKGEAVTIDPNGPPPAAPADPVRAAFLHAFESDLTRPAEFGPIAPLTAPPAWGRTVAGAGGSIQHHESFRGGFVVRVALHGLRPLHRYILTLNGNPALPGNNRLVDPVPGNPAERYLDFLTVTTDGTGSYEATFGILLPTGPYGVRFYVKDTDDFKIILYRDYFRFTVD